MGFSGEWRHANRSLESTLGTVSSIKIEQIITENVLLTERAMSIYVFLFKSNLVFEKKLI